MNQLNFVVRAAALLMAGAFAIQCSSDDNANPTGVGGAGGGSADGGKDSAVGTGGDATPDGTGGGGGGTTKPGVQVVLDGASVPKYVEPLPTFDGKRVGTAAITVDMVEFQEKILPASVYADVPDPYKAGTYLWGYNVNGSGAQWPSTTIEAKRMTSTVVTYTNHLQGQNGAPPVLQKWLVTDLSLHWSDPLHITHDPNNNCMSGPPLAAGCLTSYGGPVPTTVHLHGAEVLSDFDGQPDTWFTPGLALKGPAFVSNVYTYPNGQEATTLWFHDHSLGTTRLNVYAGLAGFYLIRDDRDTGIANNPLGLPAGPFETELLIADRQFDANGQLLFPNGAPGNRFGINGPPPNPDTHPYWNPEFFGDVVPLMEKSWPFMSAAPSVSLPYRQFLERANVQNEPRGFVVDGQGAHRRRCARTDSVDLADRFGRRVLDAPVRLNSPGDDAEDPASPLLFLARRRADIIVDFGLRIGRKDVHARQRRGGAFPERGSSGPETAGQIMEFRVGTSLLDGGADTSFNPASRTDAGADAARRAMVDFRPTAARPADKTRQLVLVGRGGSVVRSSVGQQLALERLPRGELSRHPGSTSNMAGITATETPQIGSTGSGRSPT